MAHDPGKSKPFSSYIHYGPVCWEWMGSISHRGYGQFWSKGKTRLAHRYSYETHSGEIPDGLVVCHSCDNPRCVRHDHLFLGTSSDNEQDKLSKRRHHNQKKTHCPKGHEYTPENTYYTGEWRSCRSCKCRS